MKSFGMNYFIMNHLSHKLRAKMEERTSVEGMESHMYLFYMWKGHVGTEGRGAEELKVRSLHSSGDTDAYWRSQGREQTPKSSFTDGER